MPTRPKNILRRPEKHPEGTKEVSRYKEAVMQAGDADQEENQYSGHKIGPRSRFETPLIPRDAEFRGGSFYDGFEAIRGEFRA